MYSTVTMKQKYYLSNLVNQRKKENKIRPQTKEIFSTVREDTSARIDPKKKNIQNILSFEMIMIIKRFWNLAYA